MSARAYIPLAAGDVALGDVVRRAGRPLQIGIVRGVVGEVVIVRWSANGPERPHLRAELERRVDRTEVLAPARAAV